MLSFKDSFWGKDVTYYEWGQRRIVNFRFDPKFSIVGKYVWDFREVDVGVLKIYDGCYGARFVRNEILKENMVRHIFRIALLEIVTPGWWFLSVLGGMYMIWCIVVKD